MESIVHNPLFSLFLTFVVYSLMMKARKHIKSPLFNPLLISSILLIVILIVLKIPYNEYKEGTQILTLLIGPATVCLAIPLYKHTKALKSFVKPVLIGVTAGVLTHALCILVASKIMDFGSSLTVSLIPKSVTTAIAKDLAFNYGGNISITIPIVIVTGILGAAIAPLIYKRFNIKSPIARGIGLGTAAHAVGTSKAIEMGELEGTFAGIALIISGLFTVILAPLLMILIHILF